MQPDLLSPEKDENLPEPFSPQELTPPGSPSIEESQLEPPPVVEATNVSPSPVGKKRLKFNPAYLALGVLVFLLFAAFAWVGYWVYNLSTELTNTQQQLAALQADHAQLQADYKTLKSENEKLNAEFTQAGADLEKANDDLAAAQADLATSRDQNKSLNARFDKGSKLAEILYVFITINGENDFLTLNQLITDSNNQDLLAEWDKVTSSPSSDAFSEFLKYLITATHDSLK